MSSIHISSQRVKNLLRDIQDLNIQELDDFVQRILIIRAQKIAPNLSEKETNLFQQINLELSDKQRIRMNTLIEKRQQERISEQELQELIQLTTLAEKLNVERIIALGELSKIRQVSLSNLMQQLGIESQLYV